MKRGLTVLIEVHDMDNLIRVRDRVIGFPHKSYSLLGINNRDLRTFKTDLSTTIRLAEFVEDKQILVAESGIRDCHRVRRVDGPGASALRHGAFQAERLILEAWDVEKLDGPAAR